MLATFKKGLLEELKDQIQFLPRLMDFVNARSMARDTWDRIQERRAERSANYFLYPIRVALATKEKKT